MRGDGGVGAGGGLPDTLRIHVDIGHPAHVHFFRQPLRQWASHGHRVRVTSRDKDVAIELLDAFGIEHRTLSRVGRGILGLGAELATRTARLRGELRRFDADVVTAIGGGFMLATVVVILVTSNTSPTTTMLCVAPSTMNTGTAITM